MQNERENLPGRLDKLGDTSTEEFRRQLHEVADWIADFRRDLECLRVEPNNKAGATLAALPVEPPEEGEPFETILADVDRNIVPVMFNWNHAMCTGNFGW